MADVVRQMAEPGAAAGPKVYSASSEDSSPAPNLAANSVVLHLHVPKDEPVAASYNYEREFLNYKPDVTLPYAYTEDDTFSVKLEVVAGTEGDGVGAEAGAPDGLEAAVARDPPGRGAKTDTGVGGGGVGGGGGGADAFVSTESAGYARRVANVLRDIEQKNNDNEWPMSTSVSCYWCCHGFMCPPIGLPVKYLPCETGFYVTGCFCSIPCAAAYNLDSRESNDTVCERHSLLSALAQKLHGSAEVRVAPPRTALTKFGGYMGIQRFRGFTEETERCIILANLPPMRSQTLQLEEVNEGDVGSGYKFQPLDPVRIERGMQELSLKRAKPLLDYKNTLDHTMCVKVVTKARG